MTVEQVSQNMEEFNNKAKHLIINNKLIAIVFTKNKILYVPVVDIDKPDSNHAYISVRGYLHTLVVLLNNKPIGYIACVKMGYANVKEWRSALKL